MSYDTGPRRFATTRWSLILSVASDSTSTESRRALATLCELYWYPVYAFIRRSGYRSDEAQDLAQAFFARLLEKGFLHEARAERGRFRSFLLASVRHFLSNEMDRQRAAKRGGGQVHVPLQIEDGERRYRLESVDELTPERVYEQRWAVETIKMAMNRLAARHSASDSIDVFKRLRPFLTADNLVPPQELATDLGMTSGALRVTIHRLRRQFAAALRDTIADTVDRPEDVDDELRYLLAVISR